ncbi:hypothetical protein [Sphingomonas sp. UYP23]
MKESRLSGRKPVYTYVTASGGWRFRRNGFDVALPGIPGETCFEVKYAKLNGG